MTHGLNDTEWANPVNYERMRNERLAKAKAAMKENQMDALVCFFADNIRYLTGTLGIPIPKIMRYCIVTPDHDPILYEQGGDTGRIKQNAPWIKDLRVALPIHFVSYQEVVAWAKEIKGLLEELGLKKPRIGFDGTSFKLARALQEAGIDAHDGASVMAKARSVKTADEIELIKESVALADLAFEEARRLLRPGVRECDIQAGMSKVLMERGVEMVRGVCTARSYPYWRTFNSMRQVRTGDIFIIDRVHLYKGYACDHVRSFTCGKATAKQKDLYKRCKERLHATLDQVKPGNTTADVQTGLRDPDDFSETTLHFGHGIGLDTHEWPFVTASSTKEWAVLEKDMTMAFETYEHDGVQGVRLEENILITDDGYTLLSTYPLGQDFE